MGELWAQGRGEQNPLGLEGLVQGYGKRLNSQHFTIPEEFHSVMFFWRGEGENCVVEDLNNLTCLRADNYQISAS